MKRYGYIMEKIITDENLEASFDWILRTRKRRKSRTGKKLLEHKEETISRMREELSNGTYKLGELKRVERRERNKTRKIDYATLYDRMVLNAIMTVVEPYLNKSFIKTTGASIPGRGGLYLHKILKSWTIKDPEGTKFVYQCDIRKFYESINQGLVIDCLRRKFKDKRLLKLLEDIIHSLPSGLSIGLRSSQSEGNLFLSQWFDHIIKDKFGFKYDIRYCDNQLFLAADYRTLTRIQRIVHDQAKKCGVQIKEDETMFPRSKRDIDFLSWRLFSNGKVEIRKHIKKRFAKRWKRVKSYKRRVELIGSFYGIAKHADAKHLFKKLTSQSMKQFSELGLGSYTFKGGKKHFDCTLYKMADLQNLKITIIDFERDIETSQGEGRYLIQFRCDELGEGKVFTSSEELKYYLNKVEEMGELPFETTIKRKTYDQNKAKYIFT